MQLWANDVPPTNRSTVEFRSTSCGKARGPALHALEGVHGYKAALAVEGADWNLNAGTGRWRLSVAHPAIAPERPPLSRSSLCPYTRVNESARPVEFSPHACSLAEAVCDPCRGLSPGDTENGLCLPAFRFD